MKKRGLEIKRITRTACILLLLCCSLLLSGCGEEEPELTHGITVEDDTEKPYSSETAARAEAAILDLLELWYRKSSPLPIIPESAKAEITAHATQIRLTTEEARLTEKKYLSLIELIEREGESIINKIYAYKESCDGLPSSSSIGALYYDLFGTIGAEDAARLVYRLAVYMYDYRYNKSMSRYEQYGYPHLLEDAQRLQNERTALAEDVGEENFATVIRGGIMFSELFFGGALDGEGLLAFTDKELLLFIRHVRLAELTVGSEGWRVLLAYISPMLTSEQYTDYLHNLLRVASECGDLDRLAEHMPNAVRLVSHIQHSMTEQDVAYIRSGNSHALLSSVLSTLNESDWALLTELSSTFAGGNLYDEVAEQRFGSEYTGYAESITPITAHELRNAINGDGIEEAMEKYVASISPAFSYTIRKEATPTVAD